MSPPLCSPLLHSCHGNRLNLDLAVRFLRIVLNGKPHLTHFNLQTACNNSRRLFSAVSCSPPRHIPAPELSTVMPVPGVLVWVRNRSVTGTSGTSPAEELQEHNYRNWPPGEHLQALFDSPCIYAPPPGNQAASTRPTLVFRQQRKI